MKVERKVFKIILEKLKNEINETIKFIELLKSYNIEIDSFIKNYFHINEDYLLIKAIIDEIMLHIARIVDNHKDSKSIYSLLTLIKNNKYLVKNPENLDLLKECSDYLKQNYNTIKKIRNFRDKILVHIDRSSLYKINKNIALDITFEEIQHLVKSIEIVLNILEK